ncbi:MAG TPA: YIP1 family protein [Thermoanaerobaculales bacterium]|nr:YIP1 family protein [Thermoanaerobaculales bacterium]
MPDTIDRPSYEPAPAEAHAGPGTAARLSAAQRSWTVFASPTRVFSDIAIKPSWVLCLVLMALLAVAVQFVVLPHLDNEATLRARLGERADGVSDEQIERMVEQGEKFARFAPIIGLVVSPIAFAIMAAIFFILLKIVGSDVDYQRAFSTTLHAYWPPSVVASVLTAALIQRVGKIPQQEFANVVKSHPGAFLPADAPAWLTAAASTVSVFNIWIVVLLIIGFRVVGRVSTGKAVVAALVPWLVWLAAKAGLAAIF